MSLRDSLQFQVEALLCGHFAGAECSRAPLVNKAAVVAVKKDQYL